MSIFIVACLYVVRFDRELPEWPKVPKLSKKFTTETKTKSDPAPPPAPPEPSRPKLIFYTQGGMVPAEWVQEWERETGYKLVQKEIRPERPLPVDGDVYSVTPKIFLSLKDRLEWKPWHTGNFIGRVNPVFTGHQFDSSNRYSRPWRWSPYLFYIRRPEGDTNYTVPSPWWQAEDARFPDKPEVLSSIRMREQGRSINLPHDRLWDVTYGEMMAAIIGRKGTERECWKALKAGEIFFTLLPASYRLSELAEPPSRLVWKAPPKGSCIHLEVLAVREGTEHPEEAEYWASILQSPEKQSALAADTGYLPTFSRPGEHLKASPLPLPEGKWFEKSEFAMWPLPRANGP